jgi:hypothetical protein
MSKPAPIDPDDLRLREAKQKLLGHWSRALNRGHHAVRILLTGTTLHIGGDPARDEEWMNTLPSIEITLPGGHGATPEDLDAFRVVVRGYSNKLWPIRADRTYSLGRHDPVELLQNLVDALARIAYDHENGTDEVED